MNIDDMVNRIIMEPRMLVMSIGLLLAIAYTIYQLLDGTKEIKREHLIASSKHMEKQIEDMLQVEKIQIFKKYSNIAKELLPNDFILNIYMITIMALVAAFIAYEISTELFNQVPAGVLIGLVVFTLPYVTLDILVSFRRRNVRKHLPHFLLMFQQTYSVVGDSIQTLTTIKESIKDPIRGYIKEFLKNVNKGMEIKDAIDIFKSRSENEVLRSFADNLLMDIEYGNMIGAEIENDTLQAFMHEENYAQRITENSGNIVSLIAILAMFVVGVKRLLSINDEFMYILTNNNEGKVAVDLVLVIMIIVFYFVKISVTYEDN